MSLIYCSTVALTLRQCNDFHAFLESAGDLESGAVLLPNSSNSAATLHFTSSRVARNIVIISSSVPCARAGSLRGQCSFFTPGGNAGQCSSAWPHTVTTMSAFRSISSVRRVDSCAEMSTPASAITAMARRFLPCASIPADSATTPSPPRCRAHPSAIWLRQEFPVQTNSKLVFFISPRALIQTVDSHQFFVLFTTLTTKSITLLIEINFWPPSQYPPACSRLKTSEGPAPTPEARPL